jgi:hypothetical protein
LQPLIALDDIDPASNLQSPDKSEDLFQKGAIRDPRCVDGRFGIVEEVDVARDACRPEQLVQRHSTGHVALATGDAVTRDQATDGALQLCESHRFNFAASTYAATSPCCSMYLRRRRRSASVDG